MNLEHPEDVCVLTVNMYVCVRVSTCKYTGVLCIY